MNSIWTETVELPQFGSLDGNIKTDVLIVGGGIAGILCAYLLEQNGVDYALVEGKRIASGITKNTTAKVTAQHGLIYRKLLRSAGAEKARMYLDANRHAVEKYAMLCRDIDCDFERKTACVYSLDNRKKLEKEADALYLLGYHPFFSDTCELPFPVAGCIGFEEQAQFHPLKFLAGIAKNLRIYEHTFVKEFAPKLAVTDKGEISYQKLIFATHFPIDNKHGMYFLKLYQHRSYVLGLEHAPQYDAMYVSDKKTGISFRNYKDILLVGGGSHRTGKKGGNWQELKAFANMYYPNAVETHCWATQDCMSLDHIPYIGRYSKGLCDCYVATGFNKWGMTSSMVAAEILTDMVMEKENPYAALYNPSRNMLKPQLLLNGCEAVVNLLTISGRRCPHVGCALKWNPVEHSWDCPCHGSRFDTDGKVLDNPANGDMRKK